MDRQQKIEELERLTNLNDMGLLETPEQKQTKSIVIALSRIEKELHELNRNLRNRK